MRTKSAHLVLVELTVPAGSDAIGQFAPAGVLDHAARVRVERVGNGALDGRHVLLAEAVRLAQVHLQALLRREAEAALAFRAPDNTAMLIVTSISLN